ncbi:hypothetical protein SAY86_031101 [Trapa natans]|uniref:Plant bHLH transcription factor ACT-like domain-containing protein n=1 Tax=Trapa natans TaxID=22666 RepID=A0AAN7MNX7_TRANT|nr:hypothetical protein SAY86_031101 [Trapa natans]
MTTPSSKACRKKMEAGELHQKLQLLRSITHSNALDDASVILDASRYIQDLKHKVERLNEDIGTAQNLSNGRSSLPAVSVETLEKGHLISVISARNCEANMLCSVLEVFEELGFNVLEARVSCVGRFQLQVIVEVSQNGEGGSMESLAIKQAVIRAIRRCDEGYSEQEQ